jgi:hypothetical protein
MNDQASQSIEPIYRINQAKELTVRSEFSFPLVTLFGGAATTNDAVSADRRPEALQGRCWQRPASRKRLPSKDFHAGDDQMKSSRNCAIFDVSNAMGTGKGGDEQSST